MYRNKYYLYKNSVKPVLGYQRFFILDFEATCEKDKILNPQEVIEFPCLAVDGETFLVTSKFHSYVKPVVYPELSPFCIHLTGISQNAVDSAPLFADVINEFNKWLSANLQDVPEDKTIFVTCGNWDLKTMLPNQCALSKVDFPSQMKRWINLKTAFFQATGHYPRSLFEMSDRLQFQLKGKLHSGIDDCQNIVTIMSKLAVNNRFQFRETDTL